MGSLSIQPHEGSCSRLQQTRPCMGFQWKLEGWGVVGGRNVWQWNAADRSDGLIGSGFSVGLVGFWLHPACAGRQRSTRIADATISSGVGQQSVVQAASWSGGGERRYSCVAVKRSTMTMVPPQFWQR